MRHGIKSLLTAVILAGMAMAGMCQSNLYVAKTGDDAANSGQSWASPYATISNGIAHAPTAGDTVWVSNGTYVLSAELTIANAITVSAWSANAADTSIDGGYSARTGRCVTISAAATLRGFTISNGVVNNNNGGGVYLNHASAVVTNCVITLNRAQQEGQNGRGGGIYMNTAGTVIDCIISNNTASASSYGYGGGGLWSQSGGGSILNCRFLNNVLNGTNTAKGGGLGIRATAVLIVSNCVFDGNTADGAAGLQIVEGGKYVRILDCTFSNNVATNGSGGGVSFNGGFISNCVIMRNWASGGSAGIYMAGGCTGANCIIQENLSLGYDSGGLTLTDAKLENSSVLNNTNKYGSFGTAGGVYMRERSLMQSCLIAGNVATGINCIGGVLARNPEGLTNSKMQNCTVVFNYSPSAGGGLGGSNSSGNIVYYNTGAISNWDKDNSSWVSNCCTAPTNSKLIGTGNIQDAPLFIDTNSANYRLAKNSPCINTGLNQEWMTNAVDRDGRARIRYGMVDIGAYEAVYNAFIFTAY